MIVGFLIMAFGTMAFMIVGPLLSVFSLVELLKRDRDTNRRRLLGTSIGGRPCFSSCSCFETCFCSESLWFDWLLPTSLLSPPGSSLVWLSSIRASYNRQYSIDRAYFGLLWSQLLFYHL